MKGSTKVTPSLDVSGRTCSKQGTNSAQTTELSSQVNVSSTQTKGDLSTSSRLLKFDTSPVSSDMNSSTAGYRSVPQEPSPAGHRSSHFDEEEDNVCNVHLYADMEKTSLNPQSQAHTVESLVAEVHPEQSVPSLPLTPFLGSQETPGTVPETDDCLSAATMVTTKKGGAELPPTVSLDEMKNFVASVPACPPTAEVAQANSARQPARSASNPGRLCAGASKDRSVSALTRSLANVNDVCPAAGADATVGSAVVEITHETRPGSGAICLRTPRARVLTRKSRDLEEEQQQPPHEEEVEGACVMIKDETDHPQPDFSTDPDDNGNELRGAVGGIISSRAALAGPGGRLTPCRLPRRTDSCASVVSTLDICRICHCEREEAVQLISPCLCAGSMKFVHQACLQQWVQSSDTKSCELCKFPFIMTSKTKPIRRWRMLDMTTVERRKILCSVTFHVIAITCVVWSLYVLIDRTTEEVMSGKLEWPFWTKLIVVAVGFTGGLVFMYVQCKMYMQLCKRWRSFNRIVYIQDCPEEEGRSRQLEPEDKEPKT